MTFREIKKELEKIYKERSSWDGGKGPFTESAIRQRELILMKQQVLYKIEDAKLRKNKVEESFNLELYTIINKYLKELQEE
ncbi:MAG: hypothetical protein AB1410_09180 [Acidobacteriota bacterium]